MMMMPSKILFIISNLLSISIALSSNQMMFWWLSLEINTISIIPILMEKKCKYTTESTIKYFMIQVITSIMFMMPILINMQLSYLLMFMLMSMLIKLTSVPFHKWLINLIEPIQWYKIFILMTLQKIMPFYILLILNNMSPNNNMMMMSLIMSAIISSISMFSQSSLRKMMVYSSINQTAFIMTAILMSTKLWLINFIMYSIIIFSITMFFNLNNMNNFNYLMNNYRLSINTSLIHMNIMSMSGLPPFLGFMLKFNLMNKMINSNYQMKLIFTILLLSSLMSMYMYSNMYMKPMLKFSQKKNIIKKFSTMSTMINIMPISMMPIIMLYY